MTSPARLLLTAAVVLAAGHAAAQDASRLLAGAFSDHAVLQRDQPIPVWGRAAQGEVVHVSLAGHEASTTADQNGRWSATLPAMPAGGPHTLEVRAGGGGQQKVSDLLVGDVWLCSGQSNMAFPVSASVGGVRESQAPPRDALRLLTVERASSPTPLQEFPDPPSWQVAGPETVQTMTLPAEPVDVVFNAFEAVLANVDEQGW